MLPLRLRSLCRITAVAALLTAAAGCAGAPAAAPRAVAVTVPSSGTTTTPDSTRPVVTVPPLTAVGATHDATTGEPEPATTEPTPAAEPTPTTEPAPEPVAPPEPTTAEVPPEAPAPGPATPSLPAPTAPYDHVLGFHGSTRTVYLTFDDGPGPQTGAVLDVLDAAGVKATFCQVGNRVAEYPAAEQRVIADDHTLCNHSWDHQLHLGAADAAVIDAEIGRAQDAFAAAGVTVRWFRAPGGDFGTTDVLRRVAQSRGVVPLGWGVDSLDWTKPGVDAIVTNVLSQASPGAIVLLHDAGGSDRDQTIAALPRIIDGLRAAGYDLQPLPPGGL